MKYIITILIVIFPGLLILSIQDPVFLAGGSDSLDIAVLPNNYSQWIALALFFTSILHIIIIEYSNRNLGYILKGIFVTLSIIILIFSGHTYTISGKQHAYIDQWFHVPLQKFEFNPAQSFENTKYKINGMFVSVYEGDELKQNIITGPLFWGLNEKDVINVLEGFGVKKLNK